MNFTSLRYFLVVAEELNITKAAHRLYISQQSLSEHISKLEREYGVVLFERQPRLKLTYAGRCMYSFAERIVSLDKELDTQMADISSSQRGSLSIGMPPAHGRALGPDILEAFHERYPSIDINIVIDNSGRICNQVLDGNLDLAFCFNYDIVNPRLERVDYLDSAFCLVIPENILQEDFHMSEDELFSEESFDLARLENTPLITSTSQSVVQNEFLRFLQHKNIRCQRVIGAVRDHQTRLLLCSRGLGVTFTFQHVAQSFLKDYRTPKRLFCVPLDMAIKVHDHALSICYLHDRYLSNAGSAFIRLAQSIKPPVISFLSSPTG